MADTTAECCFLLYKHSDHPWQKVLGASLPCSHRAQWSLDPWIEPSSRLSVCGWALPLTRRWNSASLEWKWGLCCCLPAADTAQVQPSGFSSTSWACWHLPWPLARLPVGGGRPSCGGSLSSSPGGNERGSWWWSLGWTRRRRSVWTARTHTDPGSLVREPWPGVRGDQASRLSEGWQQGESKKAKFHMQMYPRKQC